MCCFVVVGLDEHWVFYVFVFILFLSFLLSCFLLFILFKCLVGKFNFFLCFLVAEVCLCFYLLRCLRERDKYARKYVCMGARVG